jgi:hypothetical protein
MPPLYLLKVTGVSWTQKSETLERGLTPSEARERAENKLKGVNNANNGVLVGPIVSFRKRDSLVRCTVILRKLLIF